jgi:tryptophanyl-tRNA synthetase
MDKSGDNEKSYILLLDDLGLVRRKIKSAVTDSDGIIKYEVRNKPGISNLLQIYSSLTDYSIKDLEKKYADSNYATFKDDLAEIVVDALRPIQQKYFEIINDTKLDEILSYLATFFLYVIFANKKAAIRCLFTNACCT